MRLERLCAVAPTVPSSQLPAPTHEVVGEAWEAAGGDRHEVAQLVELIKRCGLAAEHDGLLRRTRDGDRVVRSLRAEDRAPLGLALIRAGLLHDQARHIIESGRAETNGDFHCEHRIARVGAPQLVGMLSWWAVQTFPVIVIPKALLDELTTVWALLPPTPETPTWAMERQEIGNRAEMYTIQIERLRAANPARIAWVARDSDSLGWDVEDRNETPLRRIEVKGSQGPDPLFFFSENEWRKAREHADTYEVHFWGNINLGRSPAAEFDILRAAGFPLVVRGIVREVDAGAWIAEPVRWRISRPRAANHTDGQT